MCTLVLAWQLFENTPVAVVANRDEFLDRLAEPPALRDWGSTVLAPKDTEADGTWIGVNEHDVVVAVTNRWTDLDRTGDRSRGLLVRDTLAAESTEAAIRHVEQELDERDYEGFNLLVADESAAILLEWGESRRVTTLGPGVHVVVNVGANGQYHVPDARREAGERQVETAGAVGATLRPDPGEEGQTWLDRAAGVLGDHEYGACVHHEEFGTRSSSVIALGEDGFTYRYADGPPCETSFETVSGEL